MVLEVVESKAVVEVPSLLNLLAQMFEGQQSPGWHLACGLPTWSSEGHVPGVLGLVQVAVLVEGWAAAKVVLVLAAAAVEVSSQTGLAETVAQVDVQVVVWRNPGSYQQTRQLQMQLAEPLLLCSLSFCPHRCVFLSWPRLLDVDPPLSGVALRAFAPPPLLDVCWVQAPWLGASARSLWLHLSPRLSPSFWASHPLSGTVMAVFQPHSDWMLVVAIWQLHVRQWQPSHWVCSAHFPSDSCHPFEPLAEVVPAWPEVDSSTPVELLAVTLLVPWPLPGLGSLDSPESPGPLGYFGSLGSLAASVAANVVANAAAAVVAIVATAAAAVAVAAVVL